jgi:hypothetical protein
MRTKQLPVKMGNFGNLTAAPLDPKSQGAGSGN